MCDVIIFLISVQLLEVPQISKFLRDNVALDKFCIASCFVYFLRTNLDADAEYYITSSPPQTVTGHTYFTCPSKRSNATT